MAYAAPLAIGSRRWQRRPDDRPRVLMASALKLLKRRRYRRIRVEDVAEDAGVCKATVLGVRRFAPCHVDRLFDSSMDHLLQGLRPSARRAFVGG